MPTSKYLDTILNILPAVQARQINETLNDLQNKGDIRDAEEYRAKIADLASRINDRLPVPFFQGIISNVWTLASSEAHNQMMRSLRNDLESLFIQLDEIGNKVKDHNLLMMANMFSELEKGLKDQENNITTLEWLADKNNEFTSGIVNSFTSGSLLNTPLSDKEAYKFYYNNRTGLAFADVDLPGTRVDEYGEKLILDTKQQDKVTPISVVQQFDKDSYGTETVVNIEGDSNLTNIIDGINGTYWTREVYLKAPVEKVTTVLKFKIGLARDIDHIYIEGAVAEDFWIDSIKGVKPDGSKESLLSERTKIRGKTRLDFNRTLVKAVICTFSQQTYHPGQYFIPKNTNIHNSLDKRNKFDKIEKVNSLSSAIRKSLTTEALSDICNVPKDQTIEVNAFLYSFGLDNVWFGLSKYQDIGVFVSSPLKITNAGVLAINATEKQESGSVKNSIEYDIIKIDNSPNYRETRFPIPRLNQNSVSDERLALVKKIDSSDYNDTGFFRFIPYVSPSWTDGDPVDPIIIYENGEPLRIGVDWEYSISIDGESNNSLKWNSSFSFAQLQKNYKISPVRMWVKLKKANPTAVYTSSYTIRTSDSFSDNKTIWLDKESTVSLKDGGRMIFKKMEEGVTVESNIYLQVTMRRNKNSHSSSPELFNYSILASSYT